LSRQAVRCILGGGIRPACPAGARHWRDRVMIPVVPLHAPQVTALAAAARAELDNFDKVLVAAHVGSMGFYVVGAFWIKASLARAQRAIPPGQAAIVGRIVGFDFTIVSWLAFAGVGLTGYVLLGRGGIADPASPHTLFISGSLLDSGYGWKLLIMVALWAALVVSGAVMTFVFRRMLERRLDPADPPAEMDRLQRRMNLAIRGIDVLAWLNLALAIGAFMAGYALSFDRTILR
jgi:hypothetical protein